MHQDPYSLSPSGSSGSSGPGPRATDPAAHYGPRTWAMGGQEKKKDAGRGRNKKGRKGEAARQGEQTSSFISSIHVAPPDYPEDPYYHGLSARVPVFGGREKEMRGQGAPTRQAVSQGHWWQDRMYPSGELKSCHQRLTVSYHSSLFRRSTGERSSS